MSSNNPSHTPRFEPYLSMKSEDFLHVNDVMQSIYNNPGIFRGLIDSTVESTFSAEAKEAAAHIKFITEEVGEPIPFDDETEDYIWESAAMQSTISKRNRAATPDEQAFALKQLINLRLSLFVDRIIELTLLDDSHKIKPFPGGDKDGNRFGTIDNSNDGSNVA